MDLEKYIQEASAKIIKRRYAAKTTTKAPLSTGPYAHSIHRINRWVNDDGSITSTYELAGVKPTPTPLLDALDGEKPVEKPLSWWRRMMNFLRRK